MFLGGQTSPLQGVECAVCREVVYPVFFNNFTLPQICNLRYITGYGGIKYLSSIEYAFYQWQDGRFVKIFICENLRFCTSFIFSRLSFWMPFRYFWKSSQISFFVGTGKSFAKKWNLPWKTGIDFQSVIPTRNPHFSQMWIFI